MTLELKNAQKLPTFHSKSCDVNVDLVVGTKASEGNKPRQCFALFTNHERYPLTSTIKGNITSYDARYVYDFSEEKRDITCGNNHEMPAEYIANSFYSFLQVGGILKNSIFCNIEGCTKSESLEHNFGSLTSGAIRITSQDGTREKYIDFMCLPNN